MMAVVVAAVVNGDGGCVGPGENDLWWNKSGERRILSFLSLSTEPSWSVVRESMTSTSS